MCLRPIFSKDKQVSNRLAQIVAANRFTENMSYGKYMQLGMPSL